MRYSGSRTRTTKLGNRTYARCHSRDCYRVLWLCAVAGPDASRSHSTSRRLARRPHARRSVPRVLFLPRRHRPAETAWLEAGCRNESVRAHVDGRGNREGGRNSDWHMWKPSARRRSVTRSARTWTNNLTAEERAVVRNTLRTWSMRMLNYRVETLPADEAARCKVFEFAKERVLKPSLPVPTRRCFPSLINWPANSQSMWRLTTASLQDRVGRPSKQRQTDRCAARHRPDNDYGLSWIKTYGKGRVFNTGWDTPRSSTSWARFHSFSAIWTLILRPPGSSN